MNSKKELWVLLASFVLPIALGTDHPKSTLSLLTLSVYNCALFLSTKQLCLTPKKAKNHKQNLVI
jgi:hypothetical protein